MNTNWLESNIEELKAELDKYKKNHNEIGLYLKGSRDKINIILKITPSWTVICDWYEYSSIKELYNELNSDIEWYKNHIFFKEEWKKLLEQGYQFLNYDDDIMTTNESSILRFSWWSFVKNNQLISILWGVIRKYTILSEINEDVNPENNNMLKKKDSISPSCFLYHENWELFFITNNLHSITKIYKLMEQK
jgi:hypothetical protein